ncbi:MAG: hypothetical protein Q7T66_07795 [Herminiimonas sp.]|uniref:hypothetical protein n=1 Tax=Herminiimonas sp. TaxID=1926289 RepID=UPI002715DBC9|nr:hypothetical protein [Herminiimonas sp.]MDO9420547.1 hypothetical protein [Herminiimonas sp.]
MRSIPNTNNDLEEKFAKVDAGSADDYPDHAARQAVSDSYVAANTVSADTGGGFDNRTGFTGHVDEELRDSESRADSPTIHYETIPGEKGSNTKHASTVDEDIN